MYKSEAERIIRKAIEETGATFTDEQIEALSKMITKIVSQSVEEAFATFKSSSPNKPGSYS